MTKLLALAAACAALAGCGAVDKVLDCNHVCTKYKDCFDSSYDVAACTGRCNSNSDSADFRTKANSCNACIEGQSCTGAAFGCATQCVGVVP